MSDDFRNFRIRPVKVRINWTWYEKYGPRGGLRKTPRPVNMEARYLVLTWANSNEKAEESAVLKVAQRFLTNDEYWGGFYNVDSDCWYGPDVVELERWEDI